MKFLNKTVIYDWLILVGVLIIIIIENNVVIDFMT